MIEPALHTGEKMMLLRTRDGADAIKRAQDRIRSGIHPRVVPKLASLEAAFMALEGDGGLPLCEALVGPRGFLQVEQDGKVLRITVPEGSALARAREQQAVALLALLEGPRARFRLSGRISRIDGNAVLVRVAQCFCGEGRYLHEWERHPATYTPPEPPRGKREALLIPEMRAFVDAADTIIVASRAPDLDRTASSGLDVSLRAGLPGFLRCLDDRTLVWPEYPSGDHFSTLGNFMLDSRCSLLVSAAGENHALLLSGRGEIAWKDAVSAETGCDHAVTFHVEAAEFTADQFGALWRIRSYSPDLLSVPVPPQSMRPMVLSRKVAETHEVVSLYLKDAGGRPLRPLLAGQHLTLDLPASGAREYTVSSFSPRPSAYRITVKRYQTEEGGRGGSAFLHELEPGAVLGVCGPHGPFVLPRTLERPIVLVSSGIGITPMIAFAEELAWRAPKHPLWFIHGARSGGSMVFARSLRALRNELTNAKWHVRFSQPRPADQPGIDFQSEGRVDIELLRELLPLGSYDFYLCGPDPFLASLARGLRELDVPPTRIRMESFKIAEESDGRPEPRDDIEEEPDLFPREVHFLRSGVGGTWDPRKGTLLDFAEQLGIRAPHSCRTGMCGTCAQRLTRGAVLKVQPTSFITEENLILLCSTVPAADTEIDL